MGMTAALSLPLQYPLPTRLFPSGACPRGLIRREAKPRGGRYQRKAGDSDTAKPPNVLSPTQMALVMSALDAHCDPVSPVSYYPGTVGDLTRAHPFL